jgi:hypothetical protein
MVLSPDKRAQAAAKEHAKAAAEQPAELQPSTNGAEPAEAAANGLSPTP